MDLEADGTDSVEVGHAEEASGDFLEGGLQHVVPELTDVVDGLEGNVQFVEGPSFCGGIVRDAVNDGGTLVEGPQVMTDSLCRPSDPVIGSSQMVVMGGSTGTDLDEGDELATEGLEEGLQQEQTAREDVLLPRPRMDGKPVPKDCLRLCWVLVLDGVP